MLLRRKADAAVEITALAAGAGPPAKSMPTRRIRRGLCGDGEAEAEGDIRNSRRVTVVHPFDSARGRAAKRYRSPEAEAIEISKNCAGTAHRLGPCAFTQAYRESKRVLRNNTNLGIARSQEFPPQPGGSVHWSARARWVRFGEPRLSQWIHLVEPALDLRRKAVDRVLTRAPNLSHAVQLTSTSVTKANRTLTRSSRWDDDSSISWEWLVSECIIGRGEAGLELGPSCHNPAGSAR